MCGGGTTARKLGITAVVESGGAKTDERVVISGDDGGDGGGRRRGGEGIGVMRQDDIVSNKYH